MQTLGTTLAGAILPRFEQRRPIFGGPKSSTLSINQKRRLLTYARRARQMAATNHEQAPLTRTACDVLAALIWRFHNAKTGHCFPSYEAIAKAAGCSVSSVSRAIKSLEALGILTWSRRIVRRIVPTWSELLGKHINQRIPQRTSNTYTFSPPERLDPHPKDRIHPGTLPLVYSSKTVQPPQPPNNQLSTALSNLKRLFDRRGAT